MAFTSWSALRDEIKTALANHVAGSPCIGEYYIGDKRLRYRSYDDLLKLYKMTFDFEAMDTAGTSSSCVSYGRHRRFR